MQNAEFINYIRRFDEIGAGDVGIAGGKGANLGEMTRAGLPVPPGIVVTALAYRAFVRATVRDRIRTLLSEMDMSNPEDVDARASRIRALLLEQKMPQEIEDKVLASYHQLSREFGRDENAPIPVAVRSSATAEDLPTASFAGQQDTYLNVRGDAALLDHVKQCWASLWTARAVTYRVKQGFDHDKVALAVVIQAMVPSAVSGVLFTANPVSGDRDQVVINASWGLGEAIVSGAVTPDTYTVRKSDGIILARDVASKDVAIEYSQEGGTVEVPVPEDQRTRQALSDDQIVDLARLGERIEEHYHAPMDIEWGIADSKPYVLQARAITTLQEAPDLPSEGEYDRTMFLEIFPDPLTPVFVSTAQKLFHDMLDFTLDTWGVTPPRDLEAVGVFYSQPYFHREYLERALTGFGPAMRERLVAQVVNPFGRHSKDMHAEASFGFVKLATRMLAFMVRFPSRLPHLISSYHKEVAAVEQLDLDGMSDAEIYSRIHELVFGTLSRLLNYDFLMITLIRMTYQMLGGWLQRYFGDESEEVRTKLVSGVTGNITMETNKALWDLAEIAKSNAVVRAVFRAGGPDVRMRLEETPEGRAFLHELNRFLKTYGHREVKMDILYPTWGEDPTPVLAFVRRYLDLDPAASPHKQEEHLSRQREELASSVETRVKQDPVGRLVFWPIFHRILVDTQTHTRERDTMHFELTRIFPPFRRMLLELGRRWTGRDLLDEPEDIFFLTLDEVEEIARGRGVPQQVMDKVRRRRMEFERDRLRPGPTIIRNGQPVVPERPVLAEAAEGQYLGIAGSPGTVTGTARVICGPEDFDKLAKGEILVAPLTNPVWTPLFAVAGGVVTEVGGILSHGAIVAREYGIPAVMAVADATKEFRDGEILTIDGNRGIVMRGPPE